jgi:succinyl-diaminopimelate desuccinylase
MSTKDVDGHIGFGEFGQGERLVMSLGHLDVVPVGPGWKHAPFGAEIEDGYIYSRGSVDDKGPTMASFYAMRAIKEVVPNIPARMRQVFGLNEESGFGCVHRYVETEEPPTFGVAPDSGWPLYHAEKGIANLHVSAPLNQGSMQLLSAEGGQRPNIVIDQASGKVRVTAEGRKHVEAKLAVSWDRNITYSWDGDELGVYAIGKASHGAFPHGGDSAAVRLFRFLYEIAPLDSQKFFDELLELGHNGGAGLGIAGSDEASKDLTSNLGIVSTEAGRLQLLFNIRYPVTWSADQLESMCRAKLAEMTDGWKLDEVTDSKPLYFPLDHPLVRTVCEVYESETGEQKKPGTMGGGTYARAIPNTVSIGTGWEGDGGAHETDERLKVEHLYKMSRIYAHIFYRLATMEA